MAGWANLPQDLLGSILRRLPVADNIRCAAVCSFWRSTVRSNLHPSVSRPPLLMLSCSEDPTAATFFNLLDGRLHTTRLPDPPISDRLWIGSSAGWLVTADSRSEILLVNPLTRAQVALPSIATLPHVAAVLDPQGQLAGYRCSNRILSPDSIRYYLFDKAVVASNLADPNSPPSPAVTVVLILCSSPALAIARAGDETWTPIDTARCVHDVVLHKGRLYSVDFGGKVEAWDLTGPSPRPLFVLPELQSGGHFVDKYLVDSSGHLLQIWRMTGCFRFFKLDASKGEWVKVESLGDRTLFLGNNCSMSLSSRDFPELRGNCVYFTETSGLFQSDSCGNWVFSLEDGSIKPCYSHDSGSGWPLPIWITPCLS